MHLILRANNEVQTVEYWTSPGCPWGVLGAHAPAQAWVCGAMNLNPTRNFHSMTQLCASASQPCIPDVPPDSPYRRLPHKCQEAQRRGQRGNFPGGNWCIILMHLALCCLIKGPILQVLCENYRVKETLVLTRPFLSCFAEGRQGVVRVSPH